MTLLNPWQWYTATRTFSNCFEATLTSMALYYFPWELLGTKDEGKSESKDSSVLLFATSANVNRCDVTPLSVNTISQLIHSISLRLSLVLAALAVLLRPTNALIWLAIGTLLLTRLSLDGKSPLTRANLLILVREAILCG